MGLTPPTEPAALAEKSASALRRVLALVDSGELDATGRAGARLAERLRVSADALDSIAAIHREEARTGQRLTSDELLDLLVAEPKDGTQ
jgi:hypothetical protein